MIQLNISLSGLVNFRPINEKTQAKARMSGATAIKNLIRENFAKRGGHSFWAEAANATRVHQHGEQTEVWVEQAGVHLRWQGGTVLPGKSKSTKTGELTRLLAIPSDEKSQRSSPIFHTPLAFTPTKDRGHLKGLLWEGVQKTAAKPYKNKPAGRVIITPKKDGLLATVQAIEPGFEGAVVAIDGQSFGGYARFGDARQHVCGEVLSEGFSFGGERGVIAGGFDDVPAVPRLFRVDDFSGRYGLHGRDYGELFVMCTCLVVYDAFVCLPFKKRFILRFNGGLRGGWHWDTRTLQKRFCPALHSLCPSMGCTRYNVRFTI